MKKNLETRIREQLQKKEILIMSHTVIGYPTLEKSYELVDELVSAGVEMIELQFPFSEPIADGPVLLKANQESVKLGTTIDDCFQFAKKITARHPTTIFVIMTYYNILYKRGVEQFIKEAASANISGVIVPDMLIEEAAHFEDTFQKENITPIFLVTPKTNEKRLKEITSKAQGMLYCVARTGVTGHQTVFTPEFYKYIETVKKHSNIPIGIGFGIRTQEDIQNLKGHAEIAIICTKAIELCATESPKKAGEYFKTLRPEY